MRKYLLTTLFLYVVSANAIEISRTTMNLKYGFVVCDTMPLLGWQMRSTLPNDLQTAYQIQVYNCRNNKKVLDSKKRTNTSQHISVERVVPHGHYKWRVRVWDKTGHSSNWSAWQYFVITNASDAFGNSKWIGAITRKAARIPDGRNYTGNKLKDPEVKAAWAAVDSLSRRSIILSRDVSIGKKVRSAIMHICGLGFYKLSLNGEYVSERDFAPSWSDYDKTVFFNSIDLTDKLFKGNNRIEVLLGSGFYNEQGGRYRKLLVSYGPPTLRLRMEVTFVDGSTTIVESNDKWTYRLSPITFNSIYGGEDYDAQLEDGQKIKPVVIQEGPKGKLRPQESYGVRIHKQYTAKRRIQSKGTVFDMGQNLSGFPMLTVKGKRGQKVRLTVSEVLNGDSLCDQRQTGRPHYYEYTLKGDGIETWHPYFSYYGFQYIQVDGAVMKGEANPNGLPVIEDLRSCFIHDSAPEESSFTCSNDLFNKTHQIITAAIKSNMQSVFTDCPHREKLGWLEQDYLNGEGLVSNFDLACMIRQEMVQISDAQRADGSVPTTAPEYVLFEGKGVDDFAESPEWGIAFIYLPMLYLNRYGDNSLIYKYYDKMADYVRYLVSRTEDGILDMGLGDWYDYVKGEKAGFAKNTPRDYVGTCHLLMMQRYMTEYAMIIGRVADTKKYETDAENTKRHIIEHFYDAERKSFSSGSQCANAMALVLGLMPEDDREAVIENLKTDIHRHGDHLSTGDIGNRFLFLALMDNCEEELFYKIVNHHDVPGYGYQIDWGATTLTEQWDPSMGSSRNHFMMGQIEEIFYKYLAGIKFENADEVTIVPHPLGDISNVSCTTYTIYGPLKVEWVKDDSLKIKVEAPIGLKVNCSHQVQSR